MSISILPAQFADLYFRLSRRVTLRAPTLALVFTFCLLALHVCSIDTGA